MTAGVADGLFLYIPYEGLREVDTRLIGDGAHHPHDVGKFIGERVEILTRLGRLVAIFTGHYPRHLAGLLRKDGRVCQRREIFHAYSGNPLVDRSLEGTDGN